MAHAPVRAFGLALSLGFAFAAASMGCGVVTGASVAAIAGSSGGGGGAGVANNPPAAQAVTVTSSPVEVGGPHADIIEIQFTLVDAEDDPADVAITIEPTGEAALTATILGSLASLPASASGTVYKFAWESETDVVNVAELVIRVAPTNSDGQGVSGVSSPIAVVNDPPALIVSTFPPGEVDIAYGADQLTVEGGIPPFTLTIGPLQLPPGLTVVGDALEGTPTQAGTFTFDYTLRDSVGSTVSPSDPVTIDVVERLDIDTDFVPLGEPELAYSYSFPTVGGQGTLTFEVTAPTGTIDPRFVLGLPEGINLDATGVLAGTCPSRDKLTQGDDFLFGVRVTDELGATADANMIMRVREHVESAVTQVLPFARHRSLAMADVDGDGDSDIVLLAEPDGTPRLLRAVPGGEFELADLPQVPILSVDEATRVELLGDLGTGATDKVLLLRDSGAVQVWDGPALAQRIEFGTGQPLATANQATVTAFAAANLTASAGLEVLVLGAAGADSLAITLLEPGDGSSRALNDLPIGALDPEKLTAAIVVSDGQGGRLLVLGLSDTVITARPTFDTTDPTSGPVLTGFQATGVTHPIDPQIDIELAGGPATVSPVFQPTAFVADSISDPPRLILGCVLIDKPRRITLDGALALRPQAGTSGNGTVYELASALFSQPLPDLKPSPGGRPLLVDIDEDTIPDLILPMPRERSVAVIFGRPNPGPLDLRGALRVAVPSEADLVVARNHDGDPDGRIDLLAAAGVHRGEDLRSSVTLVRNIRTVGGELERRLNAAAVFLLGDNSREGDGAFGPRIAVQDFDGDGERDVIVHRSELRDPDGTVVDTIGGSQTLESNLTLLARDDTAPAEEDEALDPQPDVNASTVIPDANTRSEAGFAAVSGFGFVAGDVDGTADARAEVAIAGFSDPGQPAVSVLGIGNSGNLRTRAEVSLDRVANHLILIDVGAPAAAGATHIKDLVAVSTSSDGTVVEALLQRGPPEGTEDLTFVGRPGTTPTNLGQTRAALAGDLGGDDLADVVLVTQDVVNNKPTVFVFTGLGEGSDAAPVSVFADGLQVEVPSAGLDAQAIDAALFDSDQDGDLDVAILMLETVLDAAQNEFPLTSVIVLENQGDGTLVDLGRRTVLTVVHDSALATLDLNGDGIPDLCVLGSGALGRITLLMGRGDGSFALGATGIVGREAASLSLADVDRDNVPDIVVFTESYDEMLTITTDGDGNLIRWTR